MAEFDTTGFSVVEDFFGGTEGLNDGGIETRKPKRDAIPSRGKRQGVGSVAKARDHNLSEKLMKVGRKRSRRDGIDDDEEDLMEDPNKNSNDNDEEEMGRTGIASSQRPLKPPAVMENGPSSGPKKVARKLGKKERQRLKAQTPATDGDDQPVSTVAEVSLQEKESSRKSDEDGVPSFKKPKRRKVRSKQKNIRKDNREKKPEHLVVGLKHYQGRPLTAETRAKLNLPPPVPRTPFILNSTSKAIVEEDFGGLAIESLLEDTGMAIGSTLNPTEPKRKRSRKGRSKYKNLK